MSVKPFYFRKYTCRELAIGGELARHLPGIADRLELELPELLAYMYGMVEQAMPYEPLPAKTPTALMRWDIYGQTGPALQREIASPLGKIPESPQAALLPALLATPMLGVWAPIDPSFGRVTLSHYHAWSAILEQYSPWVNRDINVCEQWPALMVAGGQVEICIPYASSHKITTEQLHYVMGAEQN